MKTVSVALEAHIALELTTLATCWHIVRRDGTEFFFTDHDRDLTIDGDIYLAASGYSRTAISNDSSLSVDNLDVQGFLDSDSITETDLRAGLFDFAEVFVFMVNWDDLTQGILKERRGWLGEVILSEVGYFKAELRGLTQALSQNVGEVYSPECRADLGDTRCKVPINPDVRLASHLYAVGDNIRVATGGGSGQAVYENRRYECTTAGYTGPIAPTYDEDVGDTTTETGLFAIGTLTLSGQPSDTQTFTVGSKVYTLQTVLTNVDGHILIGANTAATQANILAGVNLGAGSGTVYAAAMTAHTTVDFTQGTGTSINLTSKTGGSAGNAIATTETMTNALFSSATLTGGADGAVFTARQAWTRYAVIVSVQSRSTFGIQVDEIRAVDDWFNGGVVTFETGDNAGHVIEIRNSDIGSKASSLLTITGQPSNTQTFTVGAKTYTMQGTLTNVDGNIKIGATTTVTAANILAALTLGAGSGTAYAAATTAHPTVDFVTAGGNNITCTAKLNGVTGNAIATVETLSNASFTGLTLAGGSDNQITVFLPLPFAAIVGDTLRLYPGCDKRQVTCTTVFNNIINMRAEPYVPGQDQILGYPDSH